MSHSAASLVLLPGMDGSGALFKSFTDALQRRACVVELPQSGPQNSQRLCDHVVQSCPHGDLVIMAESFSTHLLPLLYARLQTRVKLMVAVAGFLLPPWRWVLPLVQRLPVHSALKWAPGRGVFRGFFLNVHASGQLVEEIIAVIRRVPAAVIQQRIAALRTLAGSQIESAPHCAVHYLRATQDRVVTKKHVNDFLRWAPQSQVDTIQGPHFLLQTRPVECAAWFDRVLHKHGLNIPRIHP